MQGDHWKEALFGWSTAPADMKAMIASDRRRRFRRLAPLAAGYALFASVILLIVYWEHSLQWLVAVWSFGNALVLAARLLEARRDPAGDRNEAPDAAILRHSLIAGAVWGFLMGTLYLQSDTGYDAFLGAVVASVLCVGAFLNSTYPASALGYSVLVALGAFVGVSLDGQSHALEFGVLLGGCVLAIHRFTAMSMRSFIKRRQSERALRESEATVRLLLKDFEEHASDWLWRTDPFGRLEAVSDRFAEAAEAMPQSLNGANMLALFTPDSAAVLEAAMQERRSFRDLALRAVVDGREAWWSVSGQPNADGGYRGVCSDITDRRWAEARVAYSEDFDPLTELPNRAQLMRRLGEACATARTSGESFGLLCIDLDNFKSINDTMGYGVGDTYLRSIARLLDEVCGEQVLVARLGGDEFAALVHNVNSESLQELADIVVDALLAPVHVGGRPILSSGSVGLAMGSAEGPDAAELMQQAELALYRAKSQGRAGACFFEPSMDKDARWQAELEADLRTALSHNAMDVFFQPMVDPNTRKITAYETLLRWNRPGYGLVSPAEFIASAEETGIIIPLGEWVVRRALEEASLWTDLVAVSINLSPAQMRNASVVPTIAQALAANQFDPARLQIEITETVLMEETEQTLRTLHALRELGVKIALDDFGTGFSSLSYLSVFPFHKIKIDQRFVRDIQSSPENQAIVRSVIGLAADLGMEVTAEGVENEQQAALLAAFGCREVQGFLYSRPVPPREIQKRAAASNRGGFGVHTLQKRLRTM
jgi:diguanylate cyclase (GGDEF)-like protein